MNDLRDREYRTIPGDVVVDEKGERRVVIEVIRAEQIRIADRTGYSSKAIETNALWAGMRTTRF